MSASNTIGMVLRDEIASPEDCRGTGVAPMTPVPRRLLGFARDRNALDNQKGPECKIPKLLRRSQAWTTVKSHR